MIAREKRTVGNGVPFIERGLVLTSYGYVHYRAAGAGRPIVMLHTHRRASTIFLSTIKALAGSFRCYALDLLGHGDSDHPAEKPKIEDYGACVYETMELLGMGPSVLLGHTMGGFVGTEVAISHPEAVKGLILQNVPFYPSREFLQQRHTLRRSRFDLDESGFPRMRTLRDVLEKDASHAPRVPTQEWLDDDNVNLAKCGRRLWDGLEAIGAYDWDGALRRIACPTLLMWGANFLYLENKQYILERVKDHRLVLIPESGLFPQFDNPHVYQQAILDFVQGLPA